MTATDGLQVVRVRVRTHGWASPGMPLADAEALADAVTQRIADVGGSYGFVPFTGRDKTLQIRAREVIAVEIVPEAAERTGDHRPASGFAPVPGVSGPPANGTEYLQQVSGRSPRPTGAQRGQA